MLSFLKNIFKKPEAKPRLTLPSHTQQLQETPAAAPVQEQPLAKAKSKTKPQPAPPTAPVKQAAPERPGFGATPKAKEEWARQAAKRINPDATPEQLCGIQEDMSAGEIGNKLAQLYRRHNRAASSLEARLRDEAEIMLDVIAAMRQKYL